MDRGEYRGREQEKTTRTGITVVRVDVWISIPGPNRRPRSTTVGRTEHYAIGPP